MDIREIENFHSFFYSLRASVVDTSRRVGRRRKECDIACVVTWKASAFNASERSASTLLARCKEAPRTSRIFFSRKEILFSQNAVFHETDSRRSDDPDREAQTDKEGSRTLMSVSLVTVANKIYKRYVTRETRGITATPAD